jgi:hypothetical protein
MWDTAVTFKMLPKLHKLSAHGRTFTQSGHPDGDGTLGDFVGLD